jgi:hypothetical protein
MMIPSAARPVSRLLIASLLVASFPSSVAAGPTHQWSKFFGDVYYQDISDLAIAPDGGFLVVGTFQGTLAFGPAPLYTPPTIWPNPPEPFSIYLAKHTADGDHLWSVQYDDMAESSFSSRRPRVRLDGAGNIILSGLAAAPTIMGGAPIPAGAFLAGLTGTGVYRWHKSFGPGLEVHEIRVDPDDNVLAAGSFVNDVDFGGGTVASSGSTDLFVVKYDAGGNYQWALTAGDGSLQTGYALAIDPSGSVFVAGDFNGTIDLGGGPLTSTGSSDILLAKLSATGAHVWSQRFGDLSSDHAFGLAADADADVIMCGRYDGDIDLGGGPLGNPNSYPGAYVAKFDGGAGGHIWSRASQGDDTVSFERVGTDGDGDVIVAGWFGYGADFGGGPVGAGRMDVVLARYDGATGAHESSAGYGTGDDSWCLVADFAPSGEAYLGAFFYTSMDMGGGNTPGNDADIAIGKYDTQTATAVTGAMLRVVAIGAFPNPFNPSTTITYRVASAGPVSIDVYDAAGVRVDEIVSDANHDAGEYRIPYVPRLPSGVYFARITAAGVTDAAKLVLLK